MSTATATRTHPQLGTEHDPMFLFQSEDAADLTAHRLNEEDRDWTYITDRVNGGYAIHVRDENGYSLGYL